MCKQPSLLLAILYVSLATVTHCVQCEFGDCRADDVKVCGNEMFAQFNNVGDASLLQRPFPKAQRILNKMATQELEYGFPVTEDETLKNKFLHWDGNRPYIPRMSGRFEPYPGRRPPSRAAYFANMGTAEIATIHHKHNAQRMSYHGIVVLAVLACVVLGILIYLLLMYMLSSPLVAQGVQTSESTLSNQFVCCGVGRSQKEEVLAEDENVADDPDRIVDVATLRPIELDEDTFGMSLCSMTRDFYFLTSEGRSLARIVRLLKSLFLLSLTITLQILLLSFSQFVSARSVHEIRESYDTFEKTIYGENTTLTTNGKHRGILELQPSFEEAMRRLNGLSEDERDAVCRIPLSQPMFFGLILLIWTLTCFTELRKAFELQFHIFMLETVPSMAQAMRQGEEKDNESGDMISGMTTYMKVLTTLIMFLPRVAITVYLLWIGCRWLLATTDFADLIMNAVALEFVLLIKEALYVALVPTRSRHDVKNTFFEPYPKTIPPAWFNFANTLLLLAIACLWVFLYMVYFQMVLPEYKWDVHDLCVEYINERYAT